MDARRWRNIKQRLRVIGCCGSSWGSQNPSQITEKEEEEEEIQERMTAENNSPVAIRSPIMAGGGGGGCVMPATEGMINLATALAAERQQSLMRLLEEGEVEEKDEEEEMKRCRCCVYMERRKGAAFIPCGHTFCRVCSRELWLSRGSCPLCNRLQPPSPRSSRHFLDRLAIHHLQQKEMDG